MKEQPKKLNVLITGATSGIGRAVAEVFLRNGHTVYALDIKKPTEDFTTEKDRIRFFEADITSPEALQQIAETLRAEDIVLDIIANFAGIHTMGSFIEADHSEIARLMQVNLMGAIFVNKTFHPLLKQDGRILITSSEVAAYDPLPFNGIYNVSKSAVDAYAHALRQELNLLGQKVITLRPGAVETPLARGSGAATERLCRSTQLYKKESKYFCALVEKFTGTPMPAEAFANYVYKISLKKRPRYVYTKHANVGLTLLSVLPKRLQCFLIKAILRR